MKNKNKLYVALFIGFMVIISLITAWIMADNLNQDDSKIRFKLTKDYKKYKKLSYEYNSNSGKDLYLALCSKCHGNDGEGNFSAPSLKTSNIVLSQKTAYLEILIRGFQGKIIRNNITYNQIMPSFKAIGHIDLANLSNFIFKELANVENTEITPVEVITTKVASISKKLKLTPSELSKIYQKKASEQEGGAVNKR